MIGLVAALWTASGYIGAFMRAANRIYGVEEQRPFWKLRPLQLLMTIVLTVLVALVLIALVLTGPLATAIGDELGIGDTALTAWSIAKWPLLFAAVVIVIGLLYRYSPNARHEGLRWILPGSLVATILWIVASAGLQPLRRQLRLLLEHLRQPRGRHRPAPLAVADQPRDRLRRPVRRRAGAHREGRRSRHPAAGVRAVREPGQG